MSDALVWEDGMTPPEAVYMIECSWLANNANTSASEEPSQQ